jgi:SAM-dependent methyltransferase
VGLTALAGATRLGLPLVALGGIDLSTAARARAAGASGVAAIRAWLAAEDPAAAVRALAGLEPPEGRAAPTHHGGEMGHGHEGHHGRHGNPEDVDAYVAKMLDPDRDGWQRPDALLAALGVRPGLRVCEIGAGPGYFTARLSRAVGTSGRVTAVEVAPEILARLREQVESLGNVEVVHGDDRDPRLDPAARFDLVLVVNTFHHFPDGADYLARLREHLALGGRLVNVDFHPGELPVGPPPEHKVPKESFVAAARSAGLEVTGEETFLPYQYVLVLAPGRR